MSDKRHCDRVDCVESTSKLTGGYPWKSIVWNDDRETYVKHFCSEWCLAQFAVDALSQKDYEARRITRTVIETIKKGAAV